MIKPGERRCIRSSKTRLRSQVERSENTEASQGDTMATIGLIGLGNAGRPIGERILARGYPLTVYDLNPATVDNMVSLGARRAASVREAVSEIRLQCCRHLSKCAGLSSEKLEHLRLYSRG